MIRIAHVAFTGSVEVGKSIRIACANSSHKTASCEMGSKSAVMVFDDCDLDLAASACVNSAFKLSGQRCVSAGRLLVQRSILEEFKTRFLTLASGTSTCDPFYPVPSIVSFGPLISREQMEKVAHFNDWVKGKMKLLG